MNIEIGMFFGYLEPYNYIYKNKTANIEKFGNRIRKFWLLFFPMYVLLRNCRVHIPDPWSDPAPAKIDTGVGYIPTNRPAKTKARVAPANQPTTGFSRGCRALLVITTYSYLIVATPGQT